MKLTTPTGRVTASSPETTLFDLVESPSRSGGLSNVANIAGELLVSEKLSGKRLAGAAATYPIALAQRLGHLVEHAQPQTNTTLELDDLAKLTASREAVALDPRAPSKGERDRRWNVIVNTDVEIDE